MTKNRTLEFIEKSFPSFIDTIINSLKNPSKDGLLNNTPGWIGFLLKASLNPILASIEKQKKEKILANYGSDTYILGALKQGSESFDESFPLYALNASNKDVISKFTESLTVTFHEHFKRQDLLLVFQPKYHPATIIVHDAFDKFLMELGLNITERKIFSNNFNSGISKTIKDVFGEYYSVHLEDVKQKIFNDAEMQLLLETIELGRIGFKENEDLKYEETFAAWVKVSKLHESDDYEYNPDDEHEDIEGRLKPVRELIETYFSYKDADNHLQKILFIVADFGKGKSVFLKKYASDLAKAYIEKGIGYFPIYFNLRNFKNFQSDNKLGVIGEYILTTYGIHLDSNDSKRRKFLFLIDSLDESGELNKANIENVLHSVKKIQNIDKAIIKTNRLIVSTRPFDDGLKQNLSAHQPYIQPNSENKPTEYFISLYGFKKAQFNSWLNNTLQNNIHIDKIKIEGELKIELFKMLNGQDFDLYSALLDSQTLSISELRRPIFAYMVAQLILNNVNFTHIGKIGVYLSFLNLLTKEAKYIDDIDHRFNIIEQFEARNILHSIASLWNYKRRTGAQASIKKADVCRIIEGVDYKDDDSVVLENFKNKGAKEIEFLSHSYFGESNNVIHFQHQSFAEILLAEYYIKVFIKYALDDELNLDEVRLKLSLGEPTDQTVIFLNEIVQLLKETVKIDDISDEDLLQKRSLIAPLIASLGAAKYNRIICNEIKYNWYKTSVLTLDESTTRLSDDTLQNWPITRESLIKMENLCEQIIKAKSNHYLIKGNYKTSLIQNEVFTSNENIYSNIINIDKWLSLLVGTKLQDNVTTKQFFNGRFENYENHFQMIKEQSSSIPYWGKDLFKGINLEKSESVTDLSELGLDSLNFSYSYLKNVNFGSSRMDGCKFRNVTFDNVEFGFASLRYSKFINIKIVGFGLFMANTIIEQGVFMPWQITAAFIKEFPREGIKEIGHLWSTFNELPIKITAEHHSLVRTISDTISEIIAHGIHLKLFTIKECEGWFSFVNEEQNIEFYENIKNIYLEAEHLSIMD